MDRGELARRLKAARALAGYTKPETLVRHPLMIENRIPASRIKEMESLRGRVDVRPMELEVIARACGLPMEWFSARFERLAENASLEERMEALERALVKLTRSVPTLETLRQELDRQAAEDAAASGSPARGAPRRSG